MYRISVKNKMQYHKLYFTGRQKCTSSKCFQLIAHCRNRAKHGEGWPCATWGCSQCRSMSMPSYGSLWVQWGCMAQPPHPWACPQRVGLHGTAPFPRLWLPLGSVLQNCWWKQGRPLEACDGGSRNRILSSGPSSDGRHATGAQHGTTKPSHNSRYC